MNYNPPDVVDVSVHVISSAIGAFISSAIVQVVGVTVSTAISVTDALLPLVLLPLLFLSLHSPLISTTPLQLGSIFSHIQPFFSQYDIYLSLTQNSLQ